MLEFIEMMKEVHPGLFVHSVFISEKEEDDKKAGFVSCGSPCHDVTDRTLTTLDVKFGRLDTQLELVYEQLNSIPELTGGFDGMGFSQG